MRVLRTEGSGDESWTPRICTHAGQPYAILSHRWADNPNHEVLFADIEEVDVLYFGKGDEEYQTIVKNTQYVGRHPGYKPAFGKLQGAARRALNDGYAFIWIDTCCIDKNSSSELSEAINSMWMWYKSSSICYAYLGDATKIADDQFSLSSWWTRGWTLQELLAPRHLVFFTAAWDVFGSKQQMDMHISRITKIDPNVVNGTIDLHSVSIAQRMCWASSRKTTRIEDTAYCLLGIFGVNMPLIYGEGENAFLRLQQEIIRNSDDESIFAWRDENVNPEALHGLLANSPRVFAGSAKATNYRDADVRAPYTMTNKGLSLTAEVGRVSENLYVVDLNCPNPETGSQYTSIYLKKISTKTEQYIRVQCGRWATTSSKARSLKTIYVKQYNDRRIENGDRGITTDDIILLRVLPAANANIIRLETYKGSVSTSKYSVVSYVHDDLEVAVDEIWVNNEQLNIGKNLLLFLQQMQSSQQSKLYWIDYICDPYTNRYESNSTLHKWRHVWASAQECIVWLGRTDVSQAPSLNRRRLSASPSPRKTFQHVEGQHQSDDRRATFLFIFGHRYWRCASTIPELSLAQHVSVQLVTGVSDETTQIRTGCTLRELHNSALAETVYWHPSALQGSRGSAAPSLYTPGMQQMLDIILADHTAGNKDDNSFCETEKPSQPSFDLEHLLTAFRYHESSDPKDRVYALLAATSLWRNFELRYDVPLAQLFFQITRAMRANLTLTLLPKLVRALEISDVSAELWNSAPEQSELSLFEIRHGVYSLDIKEIVDDRHRRPAVRLDRNLTEPYSYCTLEPIMYVRGGLVFVQTPSTPPEGQDRVYTPQFLCFRKRPTRCSIIPLPVRYKMVLANTTATLEMSAGEMPELIIKTDNQGLRGLAFCMSEAPGTMPRICQGLEIDG